MLLAAGVLSVAAGQEKVTGQAPAPTAAELMAKMEAAMPRAGTAVLDGVHFVPNLAYQPYLYQLRERSKRTAMVIRPEEQHQDFHQTLSFRRGYYQSHFRVRSLSAPPSSYADWTIWRSDASLLTATGRDQAPSEFTGDLRLAPHPDQWPHEFLFQARPLREWINFATLGLTRDKTHFLVSCTPLISAPSPWNPPGSDQITLSFPRSGATGGLPDRIRILNGQVLVEGRLLDFRPDETGRPFPNRFTYRQPNTVPPREGRVRLVSLSHRFEDATALPATPVDVLDSRLGERHNRTMKLNQAPPPIWLVRMELDWRRGNVRLPGVGLVSIRWWLPVLLPMALLLGMALLQRKRVRAGQPSRARRAGAIRRIVMALRRPEKPL